MKRLIAVVAFVLLGATVSAQPTYTPGSFRVTTQASDPSGSCVAGKLVLNTASRHLWVCVGGSTWSDVGPATGLSDPVTTPDPLNFSGVTNFTSTVKVFQTSTHTGNNWLSLAHNGTNGVLDTGLGQISIPNGVILGNNNSTLTNNTFIGASIDGPFFAPIYAAQTPDTAVLATGSVSNSFQLGEGADFYSGFDFNNGIAGTAAATNPAFLIHGAVRNTTEYNHLNVMGSHGGNVTALTDNVATAFAHTPTIAAGQAYVGTGTYSVKLLDSANEVQVASGTFEWYAFNGTTGGSVCAIQNTGHDGVLPGLPIKATSSGTLTIALTCAVATNVATFNMTADTSLTATSFNMISQIDVRIGPAEMVLD